MKRSLLLAVAAAVLVPAATARAQFTTTVVPPKKKPTPAQAAAAAQAKAARSDSALAERLSNMKAWVDSAANVAVRTTPTDSSMRDTVRVARQPDSTVTTTSRGAVERGAASTKRFKEGAPAPDTASPLPLLLGIGASLVGAGLLLLARKPRPASARRRRQ